MFNEKFGFIGAGQMAEALMRGLIKSGLSTADRMIASDVVKDRLTYLQKEVGIKTTTNNEEVIEASEIIFLAVKPDIIPIILKPVRDKISSDHLIISIAAGVTLSKIEGELDASTRVVRVMPNTPCLVGATAAGFALGKNATEADKETVNQIFSSVGRAFCLNEKYLDAVTGLSGSGPAYVYIMIEAMADGGVQAGLPRDVALTLAAQTVFGAAKMVLETEIHPATLKDRVASPGGTTIAGIHALEQAGFRSALIDAVSAAAKRSRELDKDK